MDTTIRQQLAGATNATEYQRIVLAEVLSGHVIANWVPITVRRKGRSLVISVLGVPLQVRDSASGELTYVMASATLQQLIADHLTALLPTSLVMDEMHRQATGHVPPITHPNWVSDESMGTPARLVEESGLITASVAGLMDPTLVSDGWKTWALARGLAARKIIEGSEEAFNHGLYTPDAKSVTLGGEHAIQVLGGAHGRFEIDYSQVVLLMSASCTLDGTAVRTADLLGDPTTSFLLSDEGPLTVTRQPGAFDSLSFGSLADGVARGAGGGASASSPTLRLGSTGPDVERWQAMVGADVDGSFGSSTEAKTRAWQAAHSLVPDGVVGQATWAAAFAPPPVDNQT